MKVSSALYKLTRTIRQIEVFTSGNPKKIFNYLKNRALGRQFYKLIRKTNWK